MTLASNYRKEVAISELSPVFVMNPYYSGLGIARSLFGCGVDVYALASARDAPGLMSRYFTRSYEVPNGRDRPEQLCKRLLEIRSEFGLRPVLFPTRDLDVLFLQEYQEALSPHYLLPQRDNSEILRLIDKLELAREATRLKIPTPLTVSCGSPAELERHIATLQFPIIVKPRFAYQWRRKGVWQRAGSQKAIIVKSAAELRAQYDQLAVFSSEVLLQRYVPGDDNDIVVCGCYVAREGKMLGHFTGRKVRQDPPLVGTGSVVEACDIDGILAPSAALLGAFGYTGLAEIEFKQDKATGLYFLIEVNARHWDQHELGTLVGVNLSWIAYQDMVGRAQDVVTPSYALGSTYRWIAETELLKDMVRGLCLQLAASRGSRTWIRDCIGVLKETVLDLARLLVGKKIFAVVRVHDPLPGFLLLWRLGREAFSYASTRFRERNVQQEGADQAR
ncbi:MAG: hypothetical protein M3Q28_10470 [Pseudomonadota bacterium]|nr:hypothetical protein [Pseudomonadota bacterium]